MNKPLQRSGVVLITGSSGFIGRAIAAELADRYTVVGLDVAETKNPHLAGKVVVDLGSDQSVREALRKVRGQFGKRIASVIHLAAYYDLSGEPDPKYDEITVEGTRRLLRGLQDGFEVGQFVFASTLLVHAPSPPGDLIDETSPLEPKWAYPASKARTEALLRSERGKIPLVVLRLAGVYDERCRAAFLAQQIARIAERQTVGYLFAGDETHGQPYLHLDDLTDAVERVADRRGRLPRECTLLLGEENTPSYAELQRRLGELIHGEPWPVLSVPKPIARAGAWVQEDILDEDAFVKPWMIDISDDHYELDLRQARELLGWAPRHSLIDTLPAMIEGLKQDPAGWYADNKLNPALVAGSEAEVADVPMPSENALIASRSTMEAEHRAGDLGAPVQSRSRRLARVRSLRRWTVRSGRGDRPACGRRARARRSHAAQRMARMERDRERPRRHGADRRNDARASALGRLGLRRRGSLDPVRPARLLDHERVCVRH